MSKAKFLSKVAEEGITAAKKLFNAKTQKEATKTELKKAKQKFKNKPATQKGIKFSKKKNIKTGDEPAVMQKVGTRGEKITVGKKSGQGSVVEESTSKGMRKRGSRVAELDKKKREGTATKSEKNELTRARRRDAVDTTRRNIKISQSLRGRKKPEDTFLIALNKAKENGVLGKEFESLTKQQQMSIIRSAKLMQKLDNPSVTNKDVLRRKLSKYMK